nr:hypothetical protein [Tanacetum cinerariifolium]
GEGSSTPTEPHHTPSPEAPPPSHTTHSSSSLPPVTTTIPTDRETIAKSSTLPHDSAPRVTSPATAEGNQEIKITRLKARLKLLKDRQGVAAEGSGDDAPIKRRILEEGEAAAERISDDTEEMETILTSMDAAIVLASGAAEVPTGSGSIPTVGPSTAEKKKRQRSHGGVKNSKEIESSREDRFPYCQRVRRATRERGSEKEYHQFTSELPMERRIELISDLVKYQDNYAKVKDFRGMAFKEVEAKFNSVWKQLEDFIPMGSKEEAERIKRKDLLKHLDREDLNQLWRLVKETLSNRPPTSDKEMELWDKEIFMLVEKDYPLRKGLALVMIGYKLHVENYSQMANDLILKIYKIANSPRQKVDKGFLVGYSVNSKAFRVFNSRTRIVQETLHLNFLENKSNITGDATFDGKEHDAEKPESAVNLSPSSSALSGEQDDMTKKKDKGKSLVEYFTGNRELIADFEDYSKDNSNDVSDAGPIVPTAGQNYSNSTNPFSTAEADFNNLETSITVSPIPTTRTHKAHPISQIIGDSSLITQTRSMTRVIKDQGRLLQIFNDDFHTCMFACFLLQEEPKRVHQALKDPSWIEAMPEEIL